MRSPRLTTAWLLAALAGCAHAADPGPADPVQEATGRRAALAPLVVDNRTSRDLEIAYRPAAGAGAEVVVGLVGSGTTAETAPLPAGEPIILFARDPAGALFALPPRAFHIDVPWRWTVPADARFSPAEARP